GREIEIQKGLNTLQWRRVGEDTWKDLVTLEELKGEDGKDGEDGLTPYIGNNGNWWIGSIDTGVKAQGPDGSPGREIELRVTDTHIQWRYVGASTWTNLIALSELKGADGKDGKDGEDGSDGREIELSVNDYIRWRYVGETSWKNLIAVNDLKGEDGRDGEDGLTPYIGENGNWWIGSIDTGVKAQGPKGEDGKDGEDGLTPYIGANGNWWIGSIDTGVKAQGPDGDPGREIELRVTD